MRSLTSPRSIAPTSLEATSLRASIERHRSRLVERLEAGEDGMALGRANAHFLDACIGLLFEGATRHTGLPKGVALGAVGSFGRGAVALHSAADVVLVVDSHLVAAEESLAIAEALLYPLWDATLSVGHQVLNATAALHLAHKDLPIPTPPLALRPL